MNLFKKNLILIASLTLIFLFLFFIKLFLSRKQEKPPLFPTPTPSSPPIQIIPQITIPVATPDPKIREYYKKLDEDTYRGYPLFDYTPYETTNWKITYLKPLILVVTLKKDTPEVRQEVLDWIKSKGVDPSTHKIEWKTF